MYLNESNKHHFQGKELKECAFLFFKPTCALDGGQTSKHAESQGIAGKAEIEKQRHIIQCPLWFYISWAINTATCVQLTAIISALEIVGAMLLMNSEQVLWRGRGLGESSLGFFSSFLSSSEFSFGFSSSPLDGRENIMNTGNIDSVLSS